MHPSPTFFLAATILAVTPGPGIAYVVARTVSGGRAEGMASSAGAAVGGLLHVVAAAFGLSLIVARSALAFSIVKYLGAAYLIYLGVKTLSSKASHAHPPMMRPAGSRKAIRDGIVVEIFNIKTAMFFLAFVPQFVVPREALAPQFLLLGTICVTLNTSVDFLAVIVADRFSTSSLAGAARQRILSRVSGTTMLGLGVFTAVAKRQT